MPYYLHPSMLPKFAPVMPLPDPQLDQSESSKSKSDSSDTDDYDYDNIVDDEEEEQDDSGVDASSDSDTEDDTAAPLVRSYSSDSFASSVSSSLSFSATSSDEAEDDEVREADDFSLPYEIDEEAGRARGSLRFTTRRSRATASSLSKSAQRRHTRLTREITMQKIMDADTVGFLALLIPITGVSTMVATEVLACTHHFDCTKNYPTLSYAATFTPEGHAFMIGMCLTAFFILVSSVLFYWFLRLRLGTADRNAQFTSLVCLVAGIMTAITLSGLAILDMRSSHDAHIMFTVVFFLSSWVLIVFCHLARRLLLLRDDDDASKVASSFTAVGLSWRNSTLWASLKRWRRLSIPMAFALGRFFILAGVTSTLLCKCLRYLPFYDIAL